ncbi:MAG TPA: DUF4234 domain-containing protein [Actinomycetota bacterium]|nr:DUF4234 domain-containing protein [Actinomycetota bacterium]
MAETVTIEGRPYLKRNPLGVLGLSFITIGIYFLYWYYRINDEIRMVEHDDTIDPTRSLMAMLFGWLIIVPPFIAMWNTANHVRQMEERLGIRQVLEPAITIVVMFIFAFVNGTYIQEHLNRSWDVASSGGRPAMTPPPPPIPPAPPTPPTP